jgi:hypothetical protein
VPSKKNDYIAQNAYDRDPATWWGEGADGDGIGEWLEYAWDGNVEIREVRLISGYQKVRSDKFGDRWFLNNRLKRVRVEIPGGRSFEVNLEDKKGFQKVVIPPGNYGSAVRIVILEIYPGYNSSGLRVEDSGISEIEVTGIR